MMLVPAGFLVLMMLGALAVDSAATYLAQQQLRDSLTAAANDAVTAGLSNRSFYSSGALTLDPSQAAVFVCLSVSAQADQDLHNVRLWMAVDGAAIRLEGTATVDAVFGRAIPGFGERSRSRRDHGRGRDRTGECARSGQGTAAGFRPPADRLPLAGLCSVQGRMRCCTEHNPPWDSGRRRPSDSRQGASS
jgi:hypothetical protein